MPRNQNTSKSESHILSNTNFYFFLAVRRTPLTTVQPGLYLFIIIWQYINVLYKNLGRILARKNERTDEGTISCSRTQKNYRSVQSKDPSDFQENKTEFIFNYNYFAKPYYLIRNFHSMHFNSIALRFQQRLQFIFQL